MLRDQINSDLKNAMKSADQKTVGVLRLIISALNNKLIDKKGKGNGDELTAEDEMQAVMAEAKKRKESFEVYSKNGRNDLAEIEKAELEIIQKYLPKQMSKEEAEKIIDGIISKAEKKEIGPVMKDVMKELRGKADMATVSALVKEKLGK